MFFNKNSKLRCPSCKSKVKSEFNYCPYCANPIADFENDLKNYGLLGRNDSLNNLEKQIPQPTTITDKLVSSIFNSLMKNIEKQFQDLDKEEMRNQVKSMPNGIKITVGPQMQKPERKTKSHYLTKNSITKVQSDKIASLPRTAAKTNIRRLSDKVVYELSTPGVISVEDIFVSKLEQGYEIKAIGDKKVYVNSLPVELPIKGFILDTENHKLLVEFKPNLE